MATPDLAILHRFCDQVLRPGDLYLPADRGVILRRAHLGWATEQYEAGRSSRHYIGLGIREPELRPRHWRARTMSYACKACRYYVGWFGPHWS
ncbi:hypothetical protein D5S17_03310 [Pseudonocardiaceae bacterium YIM PH 21723]|nr:hypothetical protein D5S17_03310 [Pseudonocardiaceae bacterium YIM PH 21723]